MNEVTSSSQDWSQTLRLFFPTSDSSMAVSDWRKYACTISTTVQSPKSDTSGPKVLFQIISSTNYRECRLKIYNLPKNYYQFYFLSNISFGCVKKMSQGDIYFIHPKHMFVHV